MPGVRRRVGDSPQKFGFLRRKFLICKQALFFQGCQLCQLIHNRRRRCGSGGSCRLRRAWPNFGSLGDRRRRLFFASPSDCDHPANQRPSKKGIHQRNRGDIRLAPKIPLNCRQEIKGNCGNKEHRRHDRRCSVGPATDGERKQHQSRKPENAQKNHNSLTLLAKTVAPDLAKILLYVCRRILPRNRRSSFCGRTIEEQRAVKAGCQFDGQQKTLANRMLQPHGS